MTSMAAESTFPDDCLRSIDNLENIVQCITSRFQQTTTARHAALLFVQNNGMSLTTFTRNRNGNNRSASPSLRVRRVTTYGAKSKGERVGLSFDRSGLAGECFQSGELLIENGAFAEEGKSSKGSLSLAKFLVGTQSVQNVVFVPLRNLTSDSTSDAPARIGVIALYDRQDNAPFDPISFNSVMMENDITTASFALSTALLSDNRNLQINKGRRAREFQTTVGSNLNSVEDIGGAADLFAQMLRTNAVWVYLLQKNYNFRSGLEQQELRRQHMSHNLATGNYSSSATSNTDSTTTGTGTGTGTAAAMEIVGDIADTKEQGDKDVVDDEQTIQMPSSVVQAMSHMQARRRHSLEVKSVVVQCVKTQDVINLNDAMRQPSCYHELDMFEKEEHRLQQITKNEQVVVVSGQVSHVHGKDNEAPVALMCVPIFDEENKEVIGVIELIKRSNIFVNDDIELASLFALQISGLMRANRLEKQKAVYVRKVEVLFKVTKMVKEEADLSIVLEKLLQLVRELLESDQAQIFLQDEFHGTLACEVSSSGSTNDTTSTHRPGVAHPAEYSVATHAVENNAGFLIEDVSYFVNFTLGMGITQSEVGHEESSSGEDVEDEIVQEYDGGGGGIECSGELEEKSKSDTKDEQNENTKTKTKSNFCQGLRSVAGIVVPIATTGGRVIGAIFASNFTHKQFYPEDLELLEAFRSELRGAVARISLEASLSSGDFHSSSTNDSSDSSDSSVAALLHLYTTPEDRRKREEKRNKLNTANGAAIFSTQRPSSITMKRTSSVVGRVKRDIYHESDDAALIDWSFDPFLVDQQVLYFNFVRMLELTGIASKFELERESIVKFASEIALRYQDNSYHNFQHGFSTAHFCFISIYRCHEIEKCLRNVDVFAMLIAALMHDVDHPGHNNNYEVQLKSELALRYNDTSVLESHHAAVGWDVIYNHSGEDTIVGRISSEDLNTFRKTTIKAILHTDMIHHFSLIETLSGINSESPFDVNKPEDRITLVGMLVHAADISNPLIPNFDLVAKWVG